METEVVKAEDWARTRGMRRMRAALQTGLLFPALSSFCRLTVVDRDLLRGLNGPAVFVSNQEWSGEHGYSCSYACTSFGLVASNCRNTYCRIPPFA